MKLIGNRIYHIKLGFGEIVEQLKDKIQVRFDKTPYDKIYLIFPNKNFRTYFKFVDEDIHYKVHAEILFDEEFDEFYNWWYNNTIPKEVLKDNPSDKLRTSALKCVLRKIIMQEKIEMFIDKKYIEKLMGKSLKRKIKIDLRFFENLYESLFILTKPIFLLDKQNLCLRMYKSPQKSILKQLPIVPKQIKINSELFEHEKLFLYVYTNLKNIKCTNSKNHFSEAVTITTINTEGKVISFNAFQCKNCGKIYSDLESITRIFKNLNYPLVKIVLDNGTEPNLREYSELSIFGYNVREAIFTEQQRHELLATILFNNLLTKEKIITILQWLIKFNGKNPNCTDALKKWKCDYDFVINYNLNEQRKILSEIVEIV